ncbi:hypothetical protein BI364_08455 [Acidihalobacter yilgarnensis]|uniref:HAD family hydrolase n=1 Tax=Acidihalobacter yilgarnensis TaxID=2819280 RepID=A0A1D8INE9_9GAMM|nr:HAD-IA family hydrolase [Acidihalobacter yilgarnensis]AOU97992.1 hypothetical protein BI364_08455 [Acidihalobacter yilgarnensis]
MNRKFSLLVFDWDGTLMDSEARIVASMQTAMRALDLNPLPATDIRRIIGLGIREAVRSLYAEADEHFISRFADAYREAFLQGEGISQRLFPGVHDVLSELEATGYLLAVATGKGRAGLDRGLCETGLTPRFHATRCADESFSKPHPAMIEALMRVCGVMPEHTLMIGDTTFDLEMARNAGVASVGVSYGVHSVSDLRALDPLVILDCISALPSWLQSNHRGTETAKIA